MRAIVPESGDIGPADLFTTHISVNVYCLKMH